MLEMIDRAHALGRVAVLIRDARQPAAQASFRWSRGLTSYWTRIVRRAIALAGRAAYSSRASIRSVNPSRGILGRCSWRPVAEAPVALLRFRPRRSRRAELGLRSRLIRTHPPMTSSRLSASADTVRLAHLDTRPPLPAVVGVANPVTAPTVNVIDAQPRTAAVAWRRRPTWLAAAFGPYLRMTTSRQKRGAVREGSRAAPLGRRHSRLLERCSSGTLPLICRSRGVPVEPDPRASRRWRVARARPHTPDRPPTRPTTRPRCCSPRRGMACRRSRALEARHHHAGARWERHRSAGGGRSPADPADHGRRIALSTLLPARSAAGAEMSQADVVAAGRNRSATPSSISAGHRPTGTHTRPGRRAGGGRPTW